jgi:hypothetical protein
MKIINDLKEAAGITLPQTSIVFTGPPDMLTGQVIFENKTKNDFHLTKLPLQHKELKELSELRFDDFQVNSDLNAGQRLLQTVRISLDPHTPPAGYEMDVIIGGIRKKIKLVIQPNVSVEVSPEEITFIGTEPGISHYADFHISNNGNVTVDMPTGEYEEDLTEKVILKSLTASVKNSSGKSATDALETFFSILRQELENGVKISFGTSSASLKPGESATRRIEFTLPQKIKDQQQYEGSVKILNDKVSYKIIRSAKAEPVKKSVKNPTQKNKEKSK